MSSPRWQFSPILAEPEATYETTTLQNKWVEVLVDAPGRQEESENQKLYTYRLPAELEVKPGDILSVPFGAQVLGAIAIRLLEQPPGNLATEKIRDVEEVVASGFFPTNYWELLKRVSTYYYTPLIQVVRAALPPGLLTRSQRRIRLIPEAIPPGAIEFLNISARRILELLQTAKTGDYTWQYLQSKVRGGKPGLRDLLKRGWVESYLETPRHAQPKQKQAVTLIAELDVTDLTPRQLEILTILQRQGGELWLSELLQLSQASGSTLKALEQKGYITIQYREILRSLQEPGQTPDTAKVLTPEQAAALNTINNLPGFAQVLLHGVTGSGKTEVYLQSIAPILEQGKSALVLVPEIGLTPQLTDRFRARFGSKVCVYHSALSEGERYDTWRQMLAGEPQVVIGTRSAVFAPLPKLSLIILDEEHDSSFKQDSPAPTYHARTVAKWRAELVNCPLVLGSATPSLESWIEVRAGEMRSRGAGEQGGRGELNCPIVPSTQYPVPSPQSPKYYLSLSERIQSRPLPPVEIVDMREELREGNKSIFSRSLQEALQQLQTQKKQGILFIHRRGHSTFVSCRSCGYVIECPNCDVSLSYHHTQENAPELLRCHYCNFMRSHPENCPECSSPYLKFFGSGTQKVAEELRKLFPELRIIRFDSDTTRTKGSHRTLLTQFANGEADLLVGTQMLTKGLDISQVTLVGIVAADGLLHLSDYRATERTFQTLTQVAGRAGRGDDPGRVILQTYTPEHSVIQAVKKHDFQSFIESELPQRAESNYPPYGRLVLLRLSSLDPTQVEEAARILAGWLRPPENSNSYEILGPAPASIMRVANRYRWQILLKLPPNIIVELPDFNELRDLCPKSVSLTIDVDPINMM
ncbi:primosomal protein N' [[Phormidium ambiguum] IAM M-71]|uniref:Replication restart protein PriA n=1 Tax=[Phormidium ambiguum] IAM M-71 TaxID=454136 RepID=A0A1U7ITU3_9CYAN|nr:primosomal protein N' [Phormidium ambiguum]OKH40953.1 primosomal protein N' [Phormidium ambiguum IAM M-71]